VQVAEWDLSTRTGFEGYIRRTIKPALGHMQVRKVRGPVLDMFYARLKKCGDLACTGRPFTEHRNVPAQRWEWVDGNPADTARPPAVRPAKQLATPPADVAKVIAEGRRGPVCARAVPVAGGDHWFPAR
jgi:integrase